MQQRKLGQTLLTECDKCGGLWIDAAIFARISAEREDQVAVLGSLMPPDAHVTIEPNPRYLPCPRCGDEVREVSFATKSLQYCATCQTGGKPLADRRLSRLLK